MARINPVNDHNVPPKSKTLLTGVKNSLGMVPNVMSTMAHSPAVLQAYLAFNQALGNASLTPAIQEQIALAVAGANACQYCASAHTALGKKAGVPRDELERNLHGESIDPRTHEVITFAREVVNQRGRIDDRQLASLRAAGLTDREIVEVIATVAINIFTNYLNHIADTEIDFPTVAVADAMAA